MFFGDFPTSVRKLARICEPLVLARLQQTKPIFNQIIANFYVPGQGLAFHVDLMRQFEDGIVVASILGTCVFQFRQTCQCQPGGYGLCTCGRLDVDDQVKSVFLRAGDVVCLTGEARYNWEHGILEAVIDEWEGTCYPRTERLSITLRKLKAAE
ncbi:hypothetical protein SeMB42_g04542 [Synchytrium endobioticum]|nr:hypothetical protein SeMB42_g04542 [Synchytrium endobioticum]